MQTEFPHLLTAAVSLGFFHVIIGPDHYIPFVAISRVRKWPVLKTAAVTFFCGILHIASSVVIGIVGVRLGIAVEKLNVFESLRGGWTGWALLAFGLVYLIYGLRKAFESQLGLRAVDFSAPRNPAEQESEKLSRYFPWTLFIIFALGPCEPLIPLIMIPALRHNIYEIILLTCVFGLVTLLTMLGMVLAGAFGFRQIFVRLPDRFHHAFAGALIVLCACVVRSLGL
jgi:sulfite exporter TauE/SafE